MERVKLKPEETLLVGKWLEMDGQVLGNKDCERIEKLIEKYLQLIGKDDSGWVSIYKDPNDGRYWKLDFPQSHLHGGGPPLLKCVSKEEVKKEFPKMRIMDS